MNNTKNTSAFTVLLFSFMLIPFLSIAGIRNIVGSEIYQLWQICSMCIFLLFVVLLASEIKVSARWVLFLAYQLLIFTSTFINNGFSFGILTVTVAASALFLLLQSEHDREIIRALSITITAVAVINLPSLFSADRNTFDVVFFAGGKNSLSMLFIPAVFLIIFDSLNTVGHIKKSAFFAAALCLLTVLFGAGGTGIVVAVIALIFIPVAYKLRINKTLCLAIILAFYLLLVFSQKLLTTEWWFEFTEFLGKDSTLTSRTTIWELASEAVKNHPFFGNGRGIGFTYENIYGMDTTVHEAHNFILEILVEGGIVALIIYGTVFLSACGRLNMHNRQDKIIFAALCIVLINGLTESTLNNFLVTVILGIACKRASLPENRR